MKYPNRNKLIGLKAAICINLFLLAGSDFTGIPWDTGLTQEEASGFDKYGGWKDHNLGAIGFFRLNKDKGRWWLVTPEGNAFMSMGLNHVGASFVSGKRWIPKLGLGEKHTQKEFFNAVVNKVRKDAEAFGFNTLGTHNQTYWWDLYGDAFMPYIEPLHFVRIAAYMQPKRDDFPDVFSDDFARHCREYAGQIIPQKSGDPYLLGYSLCPVPILTEMDAQRWEGGWVGTYLPTWPRVLRNLGPEAPGKKVYVETMEEIYQGDIYAFNDIYGTSFASFDELFNTHGWKDRLETIVPAKQQEDDLAFLLKILEQYFQVVTGAIREFDPNHLILGNKLGANTDIPDEVIRLSASCMDMVFIGIYGTYEMQAGWMDRWRELADIPFMSGDMSFAVSSPEAPFATGPHCITQEERAEMTREFLTQAFARPDFVGMHWCGWIDRSSEDPPKRGVQHTGIMDEHGNYYEPLLEVFTEFKKKIYGIHAGTQFQVSSNQ